MAKKRTGKGTRLKKGWSDSEATARPRPKRPTVLDGPKVHDDYWADGSDDLGDILNAVDAKRRGSHFE